MPLIDKIFEASETGDLPHPFTVEDLKSWMAAKNIVKDDGEPYASSSIEAILSNSDTKNIPTSNNNRKVLQSRILAGGLHEYWF